jgi:hypothetical protein
VEKWKSQDLVHNLQRKGSEDWFTGAVREDPLFQPK